MQEINLFSNYGDVNHQNINNKDSNGAGVIQRLFEDASCDINYYLVLFLQYGYQITRKDRETMRDKCEYEDYKRFATLSKLSFTLYEHSDGRTMRCYLSQKEPGIKLEKGTEGVDVGSAIYKALSILYPEVYK